MDVRADGARPTTWSAVRKPTGAPAKLAEFSVLRPAAVDAEGRQKCSAEMLGQLQALALVVATQPCVAVGDLRLLLGAEELQFEEDLPVLDEERHVVCADFEHRAGAGVAAEPVVEEAGVVGSEFADAHVVGGHLGGQVPGDADAFFAREDVEDLGLDDERAVALIDPAEEVLVVVGADGREIDHAAEPTCDVADVAGEVPVPTDGDAHAQAVVDARRMQWDRCAVVTPEQR